MADGRTALRQQVARLRALPGLIDRAAPLVAKAVEAELHQQIEAGKGPDGKPWEPTKDGHLPLRNAAKRLTVKAIGSVVLIRLDGVEARHGIGAVKGGIRRPIIPTGKIPDPLTKAIDRVITDEFKKTMRGGR